VETKICLDTDFLIDFLKGKPSEVEFVRAAESTSTLAMTMINAFELFYGAYLKGNEREIASIDGLVEKMVVLPVSVESAKMAGKFKAGLQSKGMPLEFRDVLIASIALQEGYAIKTGNRKHFERIPGLKIA